MAGSIPEGAAKLNTIAMTGDQKLYFSRELQEIRSKAKAIRLYRTCEHPEHPKGIARQQAYRARIAELMQRIRSRINHI